MTGIEAWIEIGVETKIDVWIELINIQFGSLVLSTHLFLSFPLLSSFQVPVSL